jgi:uncharacterized protein YyaL (SSP411 family)
MKTTIKITAFLLVASLVASFTYKSEPAEELKWNQWNTGYPLIRSSNKIGLIDVYTEWCGWCKRMDKDTYAKKEIIDKINKDFVPIKFNPELQGTYYIDSTAYSGPQLYAMLSNNNSTGYPTTYFLIPKNDVTYVQIVAGYQSAEGFSKILDQIKASAASQ